jgi:chemotaxis protein CheX
MSPLPGVGVDEVTTIATEIFTAMVDGRTGLLTPSPGGVVAVADPLHAWVDLGTEPSSRVQLTTIVGTAADLTRAFLGMDATEPVQEADLVDALGELANVLGGNIKALLAEHVELTLPQVSRQSPAGASAVQLLEVPLAWRSHQPGLPDRPLVISLWTIG